MKWFLIAFLLIISACYSTQQSIEQYIQDTYSNNDYGEYKKNKRKILYSDTIRYDCGKMKVIHYYEE